MAGVETLLRCVPDPMNGPGMTPCPPGQIITTLETHMPSILATDAWSVVAAEASGWLILSYVSGFVIGSFVKHMRQST